jgi:hypothetical protein
MLLPDLCDIANAIESITAGLRLDPEGMEDTCWLCVVVDVTTGAHRAAAVGLTMREAAADAWVSCMELEHLLDCVMHRATPVMPDGRVRFELAEPGHWERVNHALAVRSAK